MGKGKSDFHLTLRQGHQPSPQIITFHPECVSCEKSKRRQDFPEEMPTAYDRRRCNDCRSLNCSRCGDPLAQVWNPRDGAPLCSTCSKLVKCVSCRVLKPESQFPMATKKQQRSKWKCIDCLRPRCAKCGAKRREPFGAGRRPDGPYYCSKHQPRK